RGPGRPVIVRVPACTARSNQGGASTGYGSARSGTAGAAADGVRAAGDGRSAADVAHDASIPAIAAGSRIERYRIMASFLAFRVPATAAAAQSPDARDRRVEIAPGRSSRSWSPAGAIGASRPKKATGGGAACVSW